MVSNLFEIKNSRIIFRCCRLNDCHAALTIVHQVVALQICQLRERFVTDRAVNNIRI